jgi:hypothetical protein
MVEHPPRDLFGSDSCFVVTDAGKGAVRCESPKPPKLTRGQKRYHEWLRLDCGLTFGEWLREARP